MDTKVCRKCWKAKDKSDFHFSNREKGYLCYICKECSRIATRAFYHSHAETREKVKKRSEEWARANPEKTKIARRKSEMKRKYGMLEPDYQEMLASQNGGCAICGAKDGGRRAHKWADGRFHVDHCHETGRIRGLLCHGCNVRLGGMERLLRDRPYEWLMEYTKGP